MSTVKTSYHIWIFFEKKLYKIKLGSTSLNQVVGTGPMNDVEGPKVR